LLVGRIVTEVLVKAHQRASAGLAVSCHTKLALRVCDQAHKIGP